jgi:ParB-like chromosome segregation protein Spo0J
MREIGLMTPISVRIVKNMVVEGETLGFVPVLVAGAHRLQAAKSLGWDEIPCIELEATDREVKIWEIVENLHRAELTVLERSDLSTELVRLYADDAAEVPKKLAQVGQVSGKGGRGITGGVAAAARDLGKPRATVQRDLKIGSTAPEAKEAARVAGLGDNQSALLKIAAEPTPEAQVAKVAQIVEHKRSPAAELAEREAKATRHINALYKLYNHNPGLRQWLGAKLCAIAHEIQAIRRTELAAAEDKARLGDASKPREPSPVAKLVVDNQQPDSVDTP